MNHKHASSSSSIRTLTVGFGVQPNQPNIHSLTNVTDEHHRKRNPIGVAGFALRITASEEFHLALKIVFICSADTIAH